MSKAGANEQKQPRPYIAQRIYLTSDWGQQGPEPGLNPPGHPSMHTAHPPSTMGTLQAWVCCHRPCPASPTSRDPSPCQCRRRKGRQRQPPAQTPPAAPRKTGERGASLRADLCCWELPHPQVWLGLESTRLTPAGTCAPCLHPWGGQADCSDPRPPTHTQVADGCSGKTKVGVPPCAREPPLCASLACWLAVPPEAQP